MITVKCLICHKELEVFPSRTRRFRTCSKECEGKLQAGEINTTCIYCGKQFHLKNYRKNRCRNNFCSMACHASWKSEKQRGVNNPNFRNAQYNDDGHRIIFAPRYGRIAEHKAVVFEVLDINTIPKNCQIHHRDCNPLNNMPENLVLLSNSDHRWLHHQFGNATLYAYYYGKVSLDALCDWSNNPSKARTLLNLNIL